MKLRLRLAAAAVILGTALPVCAQTALPPGFVYLRDVAPAIRQDIRYAGSHNFMGRPAHGYDAPECVLTAPAAQALKRVQETLAPRYALLVWDCYRPRRAVADFLRWVARPETHIKGEFYPNIDREDELVSRGYIAARSAHSRGSTVDVGLVPASLAAIPARDRTHKLAPCTAPKGERFEDGTVDLGTGFDCFDERARFAYPGVGPTALANRKLLRDVMVGQGFRPYEREWWHFRLAAEPFPNRAFDFPILPRPGGQ